MRGHESGSEYESAVFDVGFSPAAHGQIGMSPAHRVRLLGEHDRLALRAFCALDSGNSLFIASQAERCRMNGEGVQFWGMFEGAALRAALVLVGRRCSIFASPRLRVDPLVAVVLDHHIEFILGRADLVHQVIRAQEPFGAEIRCEEHRLAAQLTPVRVPTSTVRYATKDDLESLANLYQRSDGYELQSLSQRRTSMAQWLREWRVCVIDRGGVLVAAAGTTAEADGSAMIGSVWTAPAHRNQGYATAVVAFLAASLSSEGRTPYLFYRIDNEVAERVYLKLGFWPTGNWTVARLAVPPSR